MIHQGRGGYTLLPPTEQLMVASYGPLHNKKYAKGNKVGWVCDNNKRSKWGDNKSFLSYYNKKNCAGGPNGSASVAEMKAYFRLHGISVSGGSKRASKRASKRKSRRASKRKSVRRASRRKSRRVSRRKPRRRLSRRRSRRITRNIAARKDNWWMN